LNRRVFTLERAPVDRENTPVLSLGREQRLAKAAVGKD
jgi:hypothetical protein